MISLEYREHSEKLRSAREASQANKNLLVPEATVARYRTPSETTVFPWNTRFISSARLRIGSSWNTVAATA